MLLGILAFLFGVSFVGSLRQIEVQQRVIENGVRKQVGLFLRLYLKPGERVYLEPIGYIGYFSGANLFDYPGLVSPEVVYARRDLGLSFYSLPAYLKPDWIILRYQEFPIMQKQPGFYEHYSFFYAIDQCADIEATPWLPGRNYLFSDCAFLIFKRTH